MSEFLVLPHDRLVSVKLLACGTHYAILLAADVAAVWRLDGHLGMSAELKNERLWSSLVGVDTSVTLHRPVFAIMT